MKKIPDTIRKNLKNNWSVTILLLVAFVLHIFAFCEMGYNYNLDSDDISYINNGITFFNTGQITMHGVISAQIMPGMTFLISFFCLIFGTGELLMYALKFFWIFMGLCSILVLYKIIKIYANQYAATFGCVFFLSVDYLWMDNIILTETPFILTFLLLVYHSLKLAIDKKTKDYIMIIVWYIICLFIRPNIALYPIFLFIYLILCKYDIKRLIKQGLIAGVILLLVLAPWIYRNYKVFNKFIPLTYGTGNPLLLGTYQGYGYPSDEELDYKTNVDDKMSDEMKLYLYGEPTEKEYLKKYYSLEYDGMKAKYRMSEWWKRDKGSMLKTYLFLKPVELVYSNFYWDEILNIDNDTLALFRKIEILMFIFFSIFLLINKLRVKEWLFLMLVYASQIALYSYTFAFSRYAITLFFIRYIVIGWGIYYLSRKIKKWSGKNESISNNTCV